MGGVGSPSSELKISSITAISQSTNQIVELLSSPMYVGSSFVPQNVESQKNYYYNQAVIYFPEINTSEITVKFEQSVYSDVKIQHMYWKPHFNTGFSSSLNTQNRFDPASLSSLGFKEVQYNYADLVPNILRPNALKDQSSLITKKINITYKENLKTNRYLVSFKRTNATLTPPAEQKYYYTNAPIGLQALARQQEMAAESNVDLAFQYENLVSAEAAKAYIETRVANSEWTSGNFRELTVETIKAELSPKSITASISLQRNFEIYSAKRFVIGLRSIDISYQAYASKAQIISKPFIFGYNVKNLTISSDSSLGLQNSNSNISYIKYYVSLDDGKKWIQISPIENPFNGVPEILSFNENVGSFGKIRGVSYFNFPSIPANVKSIRVKIEIEKPKYENTTPIIHSYRIAGRVEQL